ncbi:MAG TPA: GNAT family N-acetyltransferase, partial [Ktedonobacteraceae bacterium]|nr:GNAT family N-acetyltransferase [Ktedonobacteraceae bacterium]
MEEFCRADPGKLPQGFSIHSPRLDDLEAVTHLLLACELADYGVNSYSCEGMQEDIRKLWSSGGMDLEHNAWIILAPNGLCVGRANLWFSSTEPEELFASPRIHPDYWGLGLGTYLLHRAEQRARELMVTLSEEKPVYLNSWVEGVNEPACKLLERKGFSALRYYWRMDIELQTSPPAPVLPTSIQIRPMRRGEEAQIFALSEEIFQDHWGYVP